MQLMDIMWVPNPLSIPHDHLETMSSPLQVSPPQGAKHHLSRLDDGHNTARPGKCAVLNLTDVGIIPILSKSWFRGSDTMKWYINELWEIVILQELGKQWWWLWWRQLSSDRLLKSCSLSIATWVYWLSAQKILNQQTVFCLISMGGLVSQTESICRSSSARGSARAFSRSAGGLAREMFQMFPARSFYRSWLPQKAKTALFSMQTYLFRCHIAFTGARRVDTPGWLTFPSDKCSYLSTSQIKSSLTHDSIAEHRSISSETETIRNNINYENSLDEQQKNTEEHHSSLLRLAARHSCICCVLGLQ